jgi:hypothetical protein
MHILGICFCHVRYGVSDYAAAALANGLLKDYGFITEEKRHDFIDPSKIAREKRRIGIASLQERRPDVDKVKCIGMDSKRDADSLVIQLHEADGKTTAYKTKATVDHLTFTVESGNSQCKNKCCPIRIGTRFTLISCMIRIRIPDPDPEARNCPKNK